MIEKHITELKLDQLVVQAGTGDIFEAADQTLSSIGGPSFDNTVASLNATMLNQLNSKSMTVTPKRKDQTSEANFSPNNRSGNILQASQKLAHLESLLQIAN